MKNRNPYIKAAIFVVLIFLIIVLLFKFSILNTSDINDIRHCIIKFINDFNCVSESFINDHKTIAPVLYIGIFTFRTILVIVPYSAMIILGGKLFGPLPGIIYSLIAIYLSSSVAFCLGRFLDKKIVEKILRKDFKNFDSKVEKYGFKIIFLMRLSMIFHFDLLSFAAGVSKMKYKDFILGTMIGIIPETFFLVYLGKNLNNPSLPQLIISIALIITILAIPVLFKKLKKKH